MSARVILVASLAALAGCDSTPTRAPPPAVVEVPGPVQYVPIPELMLADCPPAERLRNGITGGELIKRARDWQARALCRDEQIATIRDLVVTP